MSRSKRITAILLGAFLSAAAIALFLHDAAYLLTGETDNLNEILESGGDPPRDKYVTYTCQISLGNYGETHMKYGFIPLPGKTEQFAMLDASGLIISAEIGDRAKIAEMLALTENEIGETVLTGCFETNSGDMNRFLAEYFSGADLEQQGAFLTPYVINTTKTRVKQAALYVGVLALGVGVIALSFSKRKEDGDS